MTLRASRCPVHEREVVTCLALGLIFAQASAMGTLEWSKLHVVSIQVLDKLADMEFTDDEALFA